MSRPKSIQEIIELWDQKLLVPVEIPGMITMLLTRENIDASIASLRPHQREWFLEWTFNNYLADDTIDINSDPLPEEKVDLIRDYFVRHPYRGVRRP